MRELKAKQTKINLDHLKNKNFKLAKDLKFVNKFKEVPKESQTDRKIEYGKFSSGLKGSFKTNSNLMLGNSKHSELANNQMLNNIYRKKNIKSPHRDNYKSNSILENFSKNKYLDNSNKIKKKKNFKVDSGSNDQFANNRFVYNKGKFL